MPDSNRNAEQGSALAKAIHLLELFATSDQPLSLADVVTKTGLPRQTLHRVVKQLVANELLVRAPPRDRYTLGPAMTRLSALSLTSLGLRPPVRAILEELVELTGETCHVGVLDQHEIVYIERAEGSSPLGLKLQIGSRIPVHCTALGKLVLANRHKNIRQRVLGARPLHRFTEKTATDPIALEEQFATIRTQGYAINDEEWVEGLTAIAVPIRDAQQRTVMGLAVHAPLVRMPLSKALSYLPAMFRSAERIAEIWAIIPQEANQGRPGTKAHLTEAC